MGSPASTAVLECEYFINYELVFDESSGLGLLATPPPTSHPVVTEAAKAVTNSLSTVLRSTGQAALSYVEKMVVDKLKSLGPRGNLAAAGYEMLRG